MNLTGEDFLSLGLTMVNRTAKSERVARERFQAHFGTEAVVVADLWRRLGPTSLVTDYKCKPTHLLWCLMFLKGYGKEMVMASSVGCDESTWRKWIWLVLTHGLHELKTDLVSFRVSTMMSSPLLHIPLFRSHSFLFFLVLLLFLLFLFVDAYYRSRYPGGSFVTHDKSP